VVQNVLDDFSASGTDTSLLVGFDVVARSRAETVTGCVLTVPGPTYAVVVIKVEDALLEDVLLEVGRAVTNFGFKAAVG
jgi:hypothetical protein